MAIVIGIPVYPGTNCDFDVYKAIKLAGAIPKRIWYKDYEEIKKVDAVVIPGGFSYADYIRAGAIAARTKMTEIIKELGANGMPILGICNGFQILVESGILPGALAVNKNARFICRWVHLKVLRIDTPFTQLYAEGEIIKMPIAHMEGRYVPGEGFSDDLIVLQYSDRKGNVNDESNPNGSYKNIAGIVNREGNIMGLMPHPERASERILGGNDGLRMFKALIDYLKR
ncbi:MAG: phosphoribosylformylglycinamidine synthase I [Thermoplasmata archaeon]|nr:MAG: phosphoribosylformylglycinamidine synthase I [Thermoplasmata archaeon]